MLCNYVGYCVYVVKCMHRPNVYVVECIHRLILCCVTMSQEFEAKESHLVDIASACVCIYIYICVCVCVCVCMCMRVCVYACVWLTLQVRVFG